MMISSAPDYVIEAYLFANTPSYLFGKLINTIFVTSLVNQDEKELFEVINSANAKDLESVAMAYAALMACLRKNSDLAAIDLKPIVWAPELTSLYRQTRTSSNNSVVSFPSNNSVINAPLSTTDGMGAEKLRTVNIIIEHSGK
jgi:hypothetical protein